MRAVLSCQIPVSRVAVFAEMAFLERRPELGVLCRAARDGDHRLTAATVQSVLPGLADAGARNVVSWCRTLGLCDSQGGLTALGEEVADSDAAPVPEQGAYGLWLAHHPVMGRRALAVERLASSRDQRFDAIEPLPVEPERGEIFRSMVEPDERFQIRGFPANHGAPGCLVGETRASCRLRWTLDFHAGSDRWQLDGAIDPPAPGPSAPGSAHPGRGGGMRALRHEPESDGLDLAAVADLWGEGPLSAFGRWRPDERRLAVAFTELTPAEADAFRRTLQLARVEIPGKGVYEDVSLQDVPIGPATAADAQQWAMSRFERRLKAQPGYRSRAEVRGLFAELADGTPLEAQAPVLPAHDALLEAVADEPARYWSLAAPVDLAPYPVSAEELAELPVGGPAPAPDAPERDDLVRVPYRGGWSMRRFVQRLLGGATPRRVLLCDRYVRGEANLATLDLLMRALRSLAPALALDVWTSDDGTDFAAVEALAGRPPRAYREVFGRTPPHDRYLLIVPAQGENFGWQLSNSPLHARADVGEADDRSPLRWKDLVGMRVRSEELAVPLRRWLEGGKR